MTAVLPTVLTFVALAGPHGTTIYVAPPQIVSIIDSPDVHVCESPAEVKRKLEAVIAVPDLVNGEKSAPGSF